YEQIRSAVAIPGLPVCLVGLDAGFCPGRTGAPCQIFEDVALMRSLPNMAILEPADQASLDSLLREAAGRDGPSYLRLGEASLRPSEPLSASLRVGGGTILRVGEDITICACGIMVREALKAAEVLSQQDIRAEVIDCYSLQPFPSRLVLSSLQRTGCCVTAEEHFLSGGLFEIVSGLASREHPVPVQPVALQNDFGQSGAPQELREYYGLTAAQIVSAAVLAWTRRRR
ncbi:MAG: transketolase, partial [Fretibacterium sp.]|nr:transketolase [Fretibacterium sp.]